MRRWLPALLAAVAACAPETKDDGLAPCLVPGVARPARCGIVEVPEDPARPDGARLALRVVVLPAQGKPALRDPLFLLAGGPGQAASEAFAPVLPALERVALMRDLVLVDQRGTGASAPLDCPEDDDLARAFDVRELVRAARRCAPMVKDRALTHYGTDAAAADLEAVRRALGYGPVNVLGVSYGTRLALHFAATHPSSVRALVLDGVAPPELYIPLSFAGDAQRALDRLVDDCAADAACARSYPRLRADLDELLAKLEREPLAASLPHPRTGEPVRLELGRQPVAEVLRSTLYSPELASLLPLTVRQLTHGDAAAFVGQGSVLMEATSASSLGLSLTVLCGEDVPHITEEQIVRETHGTVFGRVLVDEMRAACAAWPGAAVPKDAPAGARTAPALLLSGELDPVTPPRWAESARGPRDRSVVVAGAGHGTLARGCVPELVATFLDRGEGSALDASCAAEPQRPAFFLDGGGPAP